MHLGQKLRAAHSGLFCFQFHNFRCLIPDNALHENCKETGQEMVRTPQDSLDIENKSGNHHLSCVFVFAVKFHSQQHFYWTKNVIYCWFHPLMHF